MPQFHNIVLSKATWTTLTKLLLSVRRLQDQSRIVAEINQDLMRIRRNWCFDNQLPLNPAKTKLLACGSKVGVAKTRNFTKLSLLGKQLVPVKDTRDLGVILDTSLTFDDHVTAMSLLVCRD